MAKPSTFVFLLNISEEGPSLQSIKLLPVIDQDLVTSIIYVLIECLVFNHLVKAVAIVRYCGWDREEPLVLIIYSCDASAVLEYPFSQVRISLLSAALIVQPVI